MRAVFSAGNGEVEIYEFSIPPIWDGHTLGDILEVEQSSPVSLTRAGSAMLPNRGTALQMNDIILVSATFEGIETIRKKILAGPEA
jgi:trk system potassium uptake protein TrkA